MRAKLSRQMFMRPAENEPDLWLSDFSRLSPSGHKYDRGHAVIFTGGLESVGTARLAARAALRTGAGLVTLAVPNSALLAHAGRPPDALMIRRADGPEGWKAALEDTRRNAVLIGPAFGVGNMTRQAVEITLNARRPTVLDADALTSFVGALPRGCQSHDGIAFSTKARYHQRYHQIDCSTRISPNYGGHNNSKKSRKTANFWTPLEGVLATYGNHIG
jgi:hypothetical protein